LKVGTIEVAIDVASVVRDVVVIHKIAINAPGELGQKITRAMMQKFAVSVSFDSLAKSSAQALDKAGRLVKGLFGK
jgi:hypothetical protein